MLQVRRPYKSLSPHWCILSKRSEESVDHLFLHCPIMLGPWLKLFAIAHLDWVLPQSIGDMMVISFRGLGNSIRGKTLWHISCLTVLWIVWQEQNTRIFQDKYKTKVMLWDLIHFYFSSWASCIVAFRGIPLSVIQPSWSLVCNSKGVDND